MAINRLKNSNYISVLHGDLPSDLIILPEKAKNCSTTQEVPSISWNQKIHY
jgi:hypothetical protein